MRLRALLPAAAALAASACGSGLPGTGPVCPHDPAAAAPIDFRVVVSSAPTIVRRDVSLAGLAAMKGSEALGGEKLQGLTVVEHRLAYKTGVALSPRPLARESCAWIDSLTVDLTPGAVAIYVPSDYADGSCEYEQVLAHERGHEEIHRETLGEAADAIRRALAKADWLPGRGTPLAVADRAEAERRLGAMVEDVVAPPYADFKKTLAERQAVLDQPENYRWVARRCSHWKRP